MKRLQENMSLMCSPIPDTFWTELKDENLLDREAPVPKPFE
jgi:hypothetical protein